jgi:hypothetical protein
MALLLMVCGTCGSERVYRDAYVSWTPTTQEWDNIINVFDDAVCEGKCEGQTKIEEIDLEEKFPRSDWEYARDNHGCILDYVTWAVDQYRENSDASS